MSNKVPRVSGSENCVCVCIGLTEMSHEIQATKYSMNSLNPLVDVHHHPNPQHQHHHLSHKNPGDQGYQGGPEILERLEVLEHLGNRTTAGDRAPSTIPPNPRHRPRRQALRSNVNRMHLASKRLLHRRIVNLVNEEIKMRTDLSARQHPLI